MFMDALFTEGSMAPQRLQQQQRGGGVMRSAMRIAGGGGQGGGYGGGGGRKRLVGPAHTIKIYHGTDREELDLHVCCCCCCVSFCGWVDV
jgi:hypothetical protein